MISARSAKVAATIIAPTSQTVIRTSAVSGDSAVGSGGAPNALVAADRRGRQAERQVLHDVGQEDLGEDPTEVERDADADAGQLAAGERRHREADGGLRADRIQPRRNSSGRPPIVAPSDSPSSETPAMVAPRAPQTTPMA